MYFTPLSVVLKTYSLYGNPRYSKLIFYTKNTGRKPGTQNLYFICFNRQPQSLVFRGH